MEILKIQRRVLSAGVTVHCNGTITAAGSGHVVHQCDYTGKQAELAADSVLMVTARLPEESLLTGLAETVTGPGPGW